MFKIIKKSKKSSARLTRLITVNGEIAGPFFMPIATRGAVKNLTTEDLQALGAQIILSNTYHLLLRPGIKLMKKSGGLHKFMNWPGPILTDSGGYQVFSLAAHRKIIEKGVKFQDPQNGNSYFIGPEEAIKIQQAIGSDIMMAFDECPPYPAKKEYVKKSLELTTRWAKRCKIAFEKLENTSSYLSSRANIRRRGHATSPTDMSRGIPRYAGKQSLLFGIIQGGIYKDLRQLSAKQITAIDFDGYAIGGVAVGEPRKYLSKILKWTVPELPQNRPRYLMGLGRPEEIIEAVKQGIDMFDCVIPTREARHGRLYIWPHNSPPFSKRGELEGGFPILSKKFYKTISITNSKFANDLSPVNNTNLKQYSKAYLHHLFKTNEPLGMKLATMNNLGFYLGLMEKIRADIKLNKI